MVKYSLMPQWQHPKQNNLTSVHKHVNDHHHSYPIKNKPQISDSPTSRPRVRNNRFFP